MLVDGAAYAQLVEFDVILLLAEAVGDDDDDHLQPVGEDLVIQLLVACLKLGIHGFEILQNSLNFLNRHQVGLIPILLDILVHILKLQQHNLHELIYVIPNMLLFLKFGYYRKYTLNYLIDDLLVWELVHLVVL